MLEGNLNQDESVVQDHTGCYEVVRCEVDKAVIKLVDGDTVTEHDCHFTGGLSRMFLGLIAS